jgi:hypothetical protein
MRSMRLRAEVDAALVKRAQAEGISINEATELAVIAWTANMEGATVRHLDGNPRNNDLANLTIDRPTKPTRTRTVTPRFKKEHP